MSPGPTLGINVSSSGSEAESIGQFWMAQRIYVTFKLGSAFVSLKENKTLTASAGIAL